MGILIGEQRKVLVRFLAVGLGIPVVLCLMELIIYFSVEERAMRAVSGTRWLIVAGLAALGVAIWAFFSQLLYRRLCDLFAYAPEDQDPWDFVEGIYGFIGVGISMSAVLGFFYYVINRDLLGSLILYGLAVVLLGIELSRFLPRMDRLEDKLKETDGHHQKL
jgi:hypothetical protein